MKIKIFISLILLFLSSSILCDESTEINIEDQLSQSDFRLINPQLDIVIELLQPIADLSVKLGKPLDVVVFPNESDEKWDRIRYKYPGLILDIRRFWEELIYIKLDGIEFITPRGVGVGDGVDALQKAYTHAGMSSLNSLDKTHIRELMTPF